MNRASVSVLSIDGGGIRGVIPATILQAIEEQMKRPIAEGFDVIAGTSTGGILALGLTKPAGKGARTPAFSAHDLLSLYVDHGHEIFDKTIWNTVKVLVDERYSVKPLEALMKERFGETMLSEALTEVVIPTYDLTLPGPFFFKRLYARDEDNDDWDVEFWKAARATSAAP